MTENIENNDIETLCQKINTLENKNRQLEAENEQLILKNKELKKQYDDFYEKEYMKRIEECNNLWSELFDIKHMSVWEFANKYCNDDQLEEAGYALARSLLGGK